MCKKSSFAKYERVKEQSNFNGGSFFDSFLGEARKEK